MKQPIDIDQEKLDKQIRFKEVPTDMGHTYRRLWLRIEADEKLKLRPVGVSVAWKYVSIAALVIWAVMVSWKPSEQTIFQQAFGVEIHISGENLKDRKKT